MLRGTFVLAALLAACGANAFGTYSAGNKILAPNDSAMRVLDAMGDPRLKEPVTNRLGAQIGEYWYYRDGSKSVRFFISGGRVVQIEQIQ